MAKTKKITRKKKSSTRSSFKKSLTNKLKKELAFDAKSIYRDQDDFEHLVVNARAGTGKTFTIIEGINRILGKPTPGVIGSPQQEFIWERMLDAETPGTIRLSAFNNMISQELAERAPEGVSVGTTHAFGYQYVRNAFGYVKPDNWHHRNTFSFTQLDLDPREAKQHKRDLISAVGDLTTYAKQMLLGYDIKSRSFHPMSITDDQLFALCQKYTLDFGKESPATVFPCVKKLLAHTAQNVEGTIEYIDMLWLPVIHNLPVFVYDLLVVDEAQDLNRLQHELALRSGRRIVLVGDFLQAIYSFAGADPDSMAVLSNRLKTYRKQDRVTELNLTVTRRCSKAVVAEAKGHAKDFEAHEDNARGSVSSIYFSEFLEEVKEADMVICRCNAPLVHECLMLLKSGKKAYVRGREIGAELVNLVKKTARYGDDNVGNLLGHLDTWYREEVQKETKRLSPRESYLILLEDKLNCIQYFAEATSSVEKLIKNIEDVFVEGGRGIELTSMHKSKGLEANRVFILFPKRGQCPHPMAKTEEAVEQEYNLLYVARTRAIEDLFYVYEESKESDL